MHFVFNGSRYGPKSIQTNNNKKNILKIYLSLQSTGKDAEFERRIVAL